MKVDYNDGKWHGWNGGECPVHPETVVEVAFTTSKAVTRKADDWSWSDEILPIIAFRVTKEHRDPREFWIRPMKDDIRDVRPADWHIKEFIHVREVIE